ncbi:unnamed protein product [Echinostoma caproni]|uniref:Ras-associating domain-containing protein n=1 Tax=Echinostoma caproni TaxID=27848 RepID=A0A183A6F1_9TREM|nr:unnamed protein product [Echinostoma caproni]
MKSERNEFRVQILGRTVRHHSDELTDAAVQEIFNKHLRTNRGGSAIVFHPDKIQFKEQGYREYIPFNEISHFYESAEHPEVFMLHVNDSSTNRFSYESYQCQSAADVRSVRNLLYSVSKNPVHLFREVSFTKRSLSSASSSSSALERSVSRNFQEQQRTIPVEPRKVQPVMSSADPPKHAPYIIPIRSTVKESPRVVRQVHTHPGIQDRASRVRVRGRSPVTYRAVSTPRLNREPSTGRSSGRYRASVYTEQYVPVTYQRTRSVYFPVPVQPVQAFERHDSQRRSGRKDSLIIYTTR